jgi:membrane protein YdbS with pleckstrin-like domain
MEHGFDQQRIFALERPSPKLMTYYALCCLLTGPLFPIVIIPNYFKYHTLRYRFDNEGISMRWGILFRREVILNYSRIQDIHLSSNIIERWLGLARVQIQTASGSASAEMTIEGLEEFEAIRNFLYSKMRGLKEKHSETSATAGPSDALPSRNLAMDEQTAHELTQTLKAVSAELRELRLTLDQKSASAKRSSDA